MKGKGGGEKVIIGILVILLIVSIAINFNLYKLKSEESIALLYTAETGTFENIDDASEIFHDYTLYNFGDAEAKNVKVRCKILDKNNNVKSSVLDNIGNVASKSYEVGEVVTNNLPFSSYEDGTIFCYVESCDNCKILYKRIPDLVEIYEG